MATYSHFYDLPVYKTCRIFRKKISTIAGKFFPEPEGFRRFHHQENIQFCRQSRGLLDETLEHMVTAYDEKYITKELLSEINKD